MKIAKRTISLLIIVALVLTSLPFTIIGANAAELGAIEADSSLVIKRPMASLNITDVTRVAYSKYSMKQPEASDSVIVKATPSGMPELTGTYSNALAYAGETPMPTQIVFTPGVELPSPPSISCNNTTVTISDYTYSNGTYTWSVTGGTAVVGTTLLFDVTYTYTDYNAVTDKYYTNTYHSYGTSYVEAIAQPAGEYSVKRTYEDFWLGQNTKNRSYVASYVLGANTYGSLYAGGSGDGSVNFENTSTDGPGWTDTGIMKRIEGQTASRDFNICFGADSNRPLTYVYFDKSIHSSLSDLNLRLMTANLSEASNSNERVDVKLLNTYVNYGIVKTFDETDAHNDPATDSIAISQLGLTGFSGQITGAGANFALYFTGSGTATVGSSDYTVALRYQTPADWSEVYLGHSHSLQIVTTDKGALRTLIESIQGTDPTVMTTDIPEGGFKGYNPQEWYYSEGWEAFFNAYKSAKSCLNNPRSSQADIDEKYNALKDAYAGLKMRVGDYSIPSAYYTQAVNKDQKYYTLASWAKVQNILDNYVSNYTSIYQPAIDKLAADLKLALDSLEEANADYTEFNSHLDTVNRLMQRAETNYGMSASKAYNNWSDLEAALKKSGCIYDELDGYIVADYLLISQQGTVDGYVLLLERAINNLSLINADLTEAVKAESAYKLINISYVVDEIAVELTAAYNALVALHGVDLSYQSKVDAATANLNDWLSKVQYKPANITAAQNMLQRAASLDRDLYDDLTAVDNAVAALESKLTLDIRYQSEIDRATSALGSAIDSLLKNAADYTTVDDAIANVEAKKNEIKEAYAEFGFTADMFYSNWSDVEAAVNAVVRGLDVTQQETVNAYATAINNALSSLKENIADYTAVNEIKTQAYDIISNGSDLYTQASLDNLTTAYMGVVTNKLISEQAVVNGYAQAIEDAIDALEYLPASYTAVENQIKLANTEIARDEAFRDAHPDHSYYTEESIFELNIAIASVIDDLDIRYQETVDGYAAAIETAIANLQLSGADYTQVDFAISAIPTDLSLYTSLSVATLNATLKAIKRDLTADKQSTVDGYVTRINNAVNGLKYKAADYTVVDTALAKVPADSSIYSEESWQYLQDQINAVVYGLDITHQAEVDTYALAIEQAIEFLQYEKADYTAVDEAIAVANAEIAKEIYTEDSVNAVQDAISAVVRDYPVGRQTEVNAFAAAINTAVGKLVQKGADYTAVNNVISIANEKIATGYYTDDTVAQLQAAIDAVVPNLPISRQEEVTAFAIAINEATGNLVEKFADYTAVTNAITAANEKIATGYYTDDTVSALQSAIDAVEPDYLISRQAEVQAFADAIVLATANLEEKPADYSAVDTAKQLAQDEIAKGIYTEDSVAKVNEAIGAVVTGYPISRQAEVQAFADAIDAARLALKEIPADYTAVTDAIAAANEKIATGYYTEDSVALLQAEIEKVDYTLGTTRQAEVQVFADAIILATANLQEKPADYSAVDTAKELAEAEIAKGIYTEESVAKVNEAINAVVTGYLISRQAEVQAFADAIDAARLALKEIPADYTAVTDAIAAANEKIATGYYTDDSVALLQAEIARVEYELGISNQSKVQEFADDIVKLTNELELKLADYTELQKILDLLDNSSSEIYTNVYTNFDEVMALINSYREETVSKKMNLTVDKQAEVNEMTATLQGYIDMLELAAEPKFEVKGTAATKKQSGVTYIYGLQTKLTKAAFQKNFADYENVTLEYEMTTARWLGTGSKLTVKSTITGEVIGEYVFVIYGDVDGNAVIDANDTVTVLLSTTGATGALTGAAKLAANVAGTRNVINIDDAEALKTVAAGSATIDQVAGKVQ